MEQQIGFCTSADGVRIAYAIAGQGYPLVRALGWGTHIEYDFEQPLWRPILQPLAEQFQLVRYDGRGTGLSDRGVEEHSLEQWTADLEAVVDAVGLERFALLGISQGGSSAINYAVKHPERVSHLILYGSFADGPADTTPEFMESFLTLTRLGWGQDHPTFRQMFTAMFVPDATLEMQKVFDDLQRLSMTADDAVSLLRAVSVLDARHLLPQVTVPTLVIHRRGDRAVDFEKGRFLAANIPSAKFVPLEGQNHIYTPDEPGIENWVNAITSFVDAPAPAAQGAAAPGSFRTILFTDLVGHTSMMQRLGDEMGRAVLREHETLTRSILKENAGTEVKTMGDGFMASFTSVTKAIECAIALQRAFAERNASAREPLAVRVGLNAGEPIEEEGDLFGNTVILAARIAAAAGGGEVFASDVVRGLCAGKGFAFADRGEQVIRGFEDAERIFSVSWQP